jgi:hypothetical protein
VCTAHDVTTSLLGDGTCAMRAFSVSSEKLIQYLLRVLNGAVLHGRLVILVQRTHAPAAIDKERVVDAFQTSAGGLGGGVPSQHVQRAAWGAEVVQQHRLLATDATRSGNRDGAHCIRQSEHDYNAWQRSCSTADPVTGLTLLAASIAR